MAGKYPFGWDRRKTAVSHCAGREERATMNSNEWVVCFGIVSTASQPWKKTRTTSMLNNRVGGGECRRIFW